MRTTLVVLLAYAVIQANAEQPDPDPANPTTTATTATTAPTATTSAGSSSSVGSKGTATASSTTGSTAPTTTTPLPMTSYALKNDKTVVDGKLLLQRSVALSSEVQSLIDEINFLEASVNATNSPYFDQMTQMQANATQMNATLYELLGQLKIQNERYANLNSMVATISGFYACFAESNCVTPTPTTTPYISTTTPPLGDCPKIEKEDVTTEHHTYIVPKVTNVRCSDVFNAGDRSNVVFEANVTIAGTGAAHNIINAQTGVILKSITATSIETVDTRVSSAQIAYSANWLSSIELNITYYSVEQSDPCEENPRICNNGTCTINPNTGGVLCICPACDSGDHCESEQNPCDAATPKRRCRVGQSTAPGTCVVDDSITEYCAYRCNCTYPIEGVTNQCGTGPSSLLQYARWWQPPQEIVQKMWQKLW
uniref:EGF-like domain-containing protein n=1 Tax=Haemonchus contortus TaxID=6289 RepID=A0A7I5EAV7_HAECO